jgi:DNA polymerase (family X)
MCKTGMQRGWPLDNAAVAQILLQMARALEYLDENPFKVAAYKKAAQALMLLDREVAELLREDVLSGVPGIGKAISARIKAWVVDCDLSDLREVEAMLPRGFDELLKVPGLGFKRIRALQRERGIETPEDLLQALSEGRLSGLRAFPKKFLEVLPAAVERVMGYRGKSTLDAALATALAMGARLAELGISSEVTGECRRGGDVIQAVELLVHGGADVLEVIAASLGQPQASLRGGTLVIPSGSYGPPVKLTTAAGKERAAALLLTTGSEGHIRNLRERALPLGIEITERGVFRGGSEVAVSGEEDIYALLGLQLLPPEVREGRPSEIALAGSFSVPELITMADIQGTIHNHSTYSDGVCTLPEMVRAARDKGYAWIGMADHSRSASYAGGLDVDAVFRQHREIDELNASLEGITVLKGIESDILGDGSLDYPEEVLALFDFVVASIHSGMEMDRKSMTKRIVKALKNPFTSVLAHPTGRLILAREPYEVDMEAVLDAALENSVALEVNSHPIRLDLDWRLIEPFTARGGVIALSPDAHTTDGLDDMRYGVMMGRKGFLTPASCLNAWDVQEAGRFLRKP